MKNLLKTLSAVLALTTVAMAAGLQPGDACPTFDVQAITGPEKGKALCYI